MKNSNLKYKVLSITFLSAALFIGSIAIDYTYGWPLIFALVGGIAAMAVNRSSTIQKSFGGVIKYSFYTIPLLILITIPSLANASEEQIARVQRLGFENFGVFATSVLLGLILSLAFIIIFAIGAMIVNMIKRPS